MRFTTAQPGKIHILRLEDGEILQESIEKYALENNIQTAKVQLLGGVDKGSKIIVGPEAGRAKPIVPMVEILDEMHEVVGNGTIFPNRAGKPKLHCHIACGRKDKTICGEIREGVIVWHVMEVIITELIDCSAVRQTDDQTGFELLFPENKFTEI